MRKYNLQSIYEPAPEPNSSVRQNLLLHGGATFLACNQANCACKVLLVKLIWIMKFNNNFYCYMGRAARHCRTQPTSPMKWINRVDCCIQYIQYMVIFFGFKIFMWWVILVWIGIHAFLKSTLLYATRLKHRDHFSNIYEKCWGLVFTRKFKQDSTLFKSLPKLTNSTFLFRKI